MELDKLRAQLGQLSAELSRTRALLHEDTVLAQDREYNRDIDLQHGIIAQAQRALERINSDRATLLQRRTAAETALPNLTAQFVALKQRVTIAENKATIERAMEIARQLQELNQ